VIDVLRVSSLIMWLAEAMVRVTTQLRIIAMRGHIVATGKSDHWIQDS
jgi:hypothetical protein